jgi:hypothetical protein
MFKKKQQPQPLQQIKPATGAKFQSFAYYLAWIGFLGAVGIAIRDVLKDHKPPKKDEYYQ